MKLEPTAKEIRGIIRNRKMAEVDKKFMRYSIPCLIVFVPTLIILFALMGTFNVHETITYDLGDGQILTTESKLPLELNGVELKPVEEPKPISPSERATLITIIIIVILSGAGLISMMVYEYYAGWKAQATLLEHYLERTEEIEK